MTAFNPPPSGASRWHSTTYGASALVEHAHHEQLADLQFEEGYPSDQQGTLLRDELLFQRAVQSYLWAVPILNMYGMKEGSERQFGKGYNVLPIWKKRLDAKTLITTPNSDVIYAMGYLDLKHDGPVVIDAPPGLQGILDDFFQRPLQSEGEIDGRRWSGDVGLAGPDHGEGGRYLVLPPDFKGTVPNEFFPFRSRTYGVLVFWRGFFSDPARLEEPVRLMEQTRIYPLANETGARPMRFPDASGIPLNLLPSIDGRAFEVLKRIIDHEYVDPADLDMRGMVASIGIVKGEPFMPDGRTREILDYAARAASKMGHYIGYQVTGKLPGGRFYPDRQYVNGFPSGMTPEFAVPDIRPSYTDTSTRSGFFAIAYSASPAMAVNLTDAGAKYPTTFTDANGDHLSGDRTYRLHLPPNIPVKLFWSVTLYDAQTGSGLDNGQRFPSINSMDNPIQKQDGSIDIEIGPRSPGKEKNWLATVRGKGFFVILRLYGPTRAFYDHSWKPGDVERVAVS